MNIKTRKRIVLGCSVVLFVVLYAIVKLFGIGSQSYKPVIIVSDSMEPTIMTGAIVMVQYCDIEDIEKDDIIMFYARQLGGFNTHRVVRKGHDYLVTQGDNTDAPDAGAVIEEMLVGKVVGVWNNASKFTGPYINPDGSYNRAHAIASFLLFGIFLVGTVFFIFWVGKWVYVYTRVIFGAKQVKEIEHYADVAHKLKDIEIKGNLIHRAKIYMTLHIFVREMKEIEYIVGKDLPKE